MNLGYPQKKDELHRFAAQFEKKLIDEAFKTSIELIRLAANPNTTLVAIERIVYFDDLRKQSSGFYEHWRNEIIKKTEPLLQAGEEALMSELTLIEQDIQTAAQNLNTQLILLKK